MKNAPEGKEAARPKEKKPRKRLFNEEQIREIRSMRAFGVSCKFVSGKFSCSDSTIYSIQRRDQYKDIQDESLCYPKWLIKNDGYHCHGCHKKSIAPSTGFKTGSPPFLICEHCCKPLWEAQVYEREQLQKMIEV